MTNGRITIHDESGQTMAEYAVVLGVITVTIVLTFSALSSAIETAFEETLEIIRIAIS